MSRGRISTLMRGDGLSARAARSSTWTILGFGGSQVLRLASNLILTRMLFPEAFGVMALVSIFMMGLAMFSDLGVGPAIMQSKRGDDPEFLNTAWTIQVIRGFTLWLVATGLSFPMAAFYGEPQLVLLIPVAGAALAISGFNPTRLESAGRHLLLGRVTAIDMATQVVGILSAVILAWIFQSVWALVISGIISISTQVLLNWRLLPGITNRFRWESPAAHELIHFGKWIFLSTVAGFFYSQGDRVVLGKYLSLEMLGVYNIGFFMASFPLLLGSALVWKILIPIYRERPPLKSVENFRKLQKMRFLLSAGLMAVLILVACSGVILIELLYDPRYASAGAVVVLISCIQVLPVIGLTYDQAALASGDSKRFFVLTAYKAVAMIAGLVIGVEVAGLFGALAGQGIATLLIYPATVWLARRQGAWDPLHDSLFALVGVGGAALAIWLNFPAVSALILG